jgi:hypothetical protein
MCAYGAHVGQFLDQWGSLKNTSNVSKIAHLLVSTSSCQEYSDTSYNLIISLEHVELNLFKCTDETCEKRFPTEWYVDDHWKKVHAPKPLECPQEGCGKTFATQDQLKRHNKKTHDPKI